MMEKILYRSHLPEQAVREETELNRVHLDRMLVSLTEGLSSRLFEELALRNVSALDFK